jgi:MerR family transcriptional regulator, thiopeptide resistance regulator
MTVGEVARMAGITVRTLHHYDRIGLLSPSGRGENGYRLYERPDLERLHRILSYRELGLSLEAIGELLDEPGADPVAHLRRQERLLRDRIARLEDLLAAVHTTLEAHTMDIDLTPEERFELFGDFDPAEHEEEARERWGDTDAWRESQRRTASYGKEEWRRIKQETGALERAFADALRDGEPADGERAMALAEAHRLQISQWFYACSHEMHTGLADMYVADPRFMKHYEDVAPGLARYVHDAIHANAVHRA